MDGFAPFHSQASFWGDLGNVHGLGCAVPQELVQHYEKDVASKDKASSPEARVRSWDKAF